MGLMPTLSQGASVNIGIFPDSNPILTSSTESVVIPDGTALFVVSYKTTQDNLFSALRSASTASQLANVFSNQLTFFSPAPVLKGTFNEETLRGWGSEGGAAVEVNTTNAVNVPIFLLLSSSSNPFSTTADFLLIS